MSHSSLTKRALLQSFAVAVGWSSLARHASVPALADSPSDWPSDQYDAGNRGYNPDATGPVRRFERRWQFPTGNSVRQTAPVVADGVVYVGSDDRSLYAIGLADGKERWSYDTGERIRSAPAVDGATVVVANGDGVAFGIDTGTGSERWRRAEQRYRYAPVIHDGVAYFATSRGPVGLAMDSGETVWSGDTDAHATAGTAYWDGSLFDCSEFTLRAFDATTGAVRWRYDAPARIDAAPTVHDGAVYVGARNGRVYAVSAADGTEDWVYDTGVREVSTSVAVADGTVYVMSVGDDATHAIDAADGTERWTFEHGSHRTGGPAPVVSDEAVYVSYLDEIYSIDPETGEAIDHVQLDDRVETTPCLVGDSILFGSRDGNVYAYTTALGRGPPLFELSNLDPERAELGAGESVTVSVTVTNTGGAEATRTVELRLDGEGAVRTERVRLAGGESTTVSFTLEPDFVGGREYVVTTGDDERRGLIAVEPAATDAGTDRTTADGTTAGTTGASGPGLGVASALAGIASAVYAVRRRSGDGKEE